MSMMFRPVARDLELIAQILQVFGDASGLHTSMENCSESPIRCQDENLAITTSWLPCAIKDFPCTYLVLPLSIRMPASADLLVLVDKAVRSEVGNGESTKFATTIGVGDTELGVSNTT